MPNVPQREGLAKILILIYYLRRDHRKKNSQERRAYESVDDRSHS